MSWMRIETEDGRLAFSPGEAIRGTVSWSLDALPESLELRLFWYTQGKGEQDVGLVQTQALELAPEGSAAIALTLPAGPYSFSGKLISLLWALELVAEPDGGAARKELVVGPGGQEVVLRELPEEELKLPAFVKRWKPKR